MTKYCVYLLSVMFGYLIQDSTAVTEMSSFYKVSSQRVNLVTFLSVKVKSRMWCAAKCLQMNDICYSFIYDLRNGSCALGSWIYPTSLQLDPNMLLYTVGAYCNSTKNFLIHLNESRSACLMLSTHEVDYATAKSQCRAKGADLSSIKSVIKFFIVSAVLQLNNVYTWIGLDDIAVEGVFRWIDDGSMVDNGIKSVIFGQDQPDNDQGIEDCVAYSIDVTYWPFFDVDCTLTMYYLCEMSPFAIKHL